MRTRLLFVVGSVAAFGGLFLLVVTAVAGAPDGVVVAASVAALTGLALLGTVSMIAGRRVLRSTHHYARLSSERTAAMRPVLSTLSKSVTGSLGASESIGRQLSELTRSGAVGTKNGHDVSLVLVLGEAADSVELERFVAANPLGSTIVVTDQPSLVARLARIAAVELLPAAESQHGAHLGLWLGRLVELVAEFNASEILVWPDRESLEEIKGSVLSDVDVTDARAMRALLQRDDDVRRSLEDHADLLGSVHRALQQSAGREAEILAQLKAAARADQREAEMLTELKSGVQAVRRSVESLDRVTGKRQSDAVKEVRKDLDGIYRQIEALSHLERRFNGRGFPPLRGWAVSPDLALDLVERVLDGGVRTVLECGSGTSTVLFAMAFEQVGGGRVVALDHDARYAEETQGLLRRYGVEQWAEVVHTPLVEHEVDENTYRWYRMDDVDLPAEIELLFVDGPPEAVGPLSRYPAFPLIRESLADHATIILDDGRREAEQEIAARWSDDADVVASVAMPFERAPIKLDFRRAASANDEI